MITTQLGNAKIKRLHTERNNDSTFQRGKAEARLQLDLLYFMVSLVNPHCCGPLFCSNRVVLNQIFRCVLQHSMCFVCAGYVVVL